MASFLRASGLEAEEGMDYSVCLLEAGRILALGSLSGRVIRGLAVREERRGEGLAAIVVTELEAEAARRGLVDLLVFTGPGNRATFSSLGYRLIAVAGGSSEGGPGSRAAEGSEGGAALLMEKGGGLEAWCEGLGAEVEAFAARLAPAVAGGGSLPRSALVMNCNPFTIGHRHLVEWASRRSSLVILFAVAEEASSFPFEVRLRLIREGTADLANVLVVPGSSYIISRATFPTYFLKDRAGEAAAIHARLDLDLFGGRIAPALGITRRFVGEEPYSEVTALYNDVMKAVLPGRGVEVEEIPRLELGGAAVSASTVRRLIREGALGEARPLVPESTWRYLVSDEAQEILSRVAAADGRH
jgi:[citrate (pro-3S)-lyase] ligase